jgi:hypothetical protein
MTTAAADPRALANELEWRKCEADPVHFLNNYWSIEIISGGYKIAGLRGYQVAEVDTMMGCTTGDEPDRQIRLKARQVGWTTIALGFAFWSAYFHPFQPWIATQQSEDEAKKSLLTKVKIPYTRLPGWMLERGPALETENMQEMRFANGSSVTAVHSGSSAARGRAAYGVIMDEAAFMEDAESLFGALDPMCYGPMFVFSTANGLGNWFQELWQDSELADSEWGRGFQPWHVVPGRDQTWYNRRKRRYRTREWLFYQEFPASPGEAFAKSGRTALPLDTLEADPHEWIPPVWRFDLTMVDTDIFPTQEAFDEALIPADEDRDFEWHVWQQPEIERDEYGFMLRPPSYVVGVDVSEGLEDGDYSAISVFNANTWEQVASAKMWYPVEDLGQLVQWIGDWYHEALVLVERNNMGLLPLDYLVRAMYPRLYRMDTIAQQKRGSRTPRYGWYTNKATKPKLVIDFIKALRSEAPLLHDLRFLSEARTFLADGKGGYGASRSQHDDMIMATLIAWQGCLDVGQYPISYIDHEVRPVTIGEVLAITMPKPTDRRGSSPMYQKLGQPQNPPGVKKSWEMMEANLLTPTTKE